MMRVGPEKAVERAEAYGIKTDLQAVPSAVLGSNTVTPMDMSAAYATFANRGIRVPPVLVTRITRSDGTVLFEHQHRQQKVMDAGLTDTLTDILVQAIERGTGTKAKLDRPAAGKTGTANDWVDAWFVGYTPELSTAVWVGFPTKAGGTPVQMRPPATPIRVTGGSYPAEIWQRFMSQALVDRPATPFTPPTTTTTLPPVRQLPPRGNGLGPLQAVPPVVGLPLEEARPILEFSGFKVAVAPVTAAEDDEKGTVVAQSPPGGQSAPRGSTVTIEVP
jgi:membrane peptidoglycan carboxypeptidase